MEDEIREKKLMKLELEIVKNYLEIRQRVKKLENNNQLAKGERETLKIVQKATTSRIEDFRMADKQKLSIYLESKDKWEEVEELWIPKDDNF